MRASLILSSILAALTTASALNEEVFIRNLAVIKTWTFVGTKTIKYVNFRLNGKEVNDISCTVRNPTFPEPSAPVSCSDPTYRFSLRPGTTGHEFSLEIYHKKESDSVEYKGQADVPTYCGAADNEAVRYLCIQKMLFTEIPIDGARLSAET
ncbi:hypothetical protein CP533_1191 [Ophiocordyceps camponoti-saundersi (nom. inval.)]|nr:hypothetical protein CP533_1191 [Ophiocordyceps camponoti-saundersi (nom. inval.)]